MQTGHIKAPFAASCPPENRGSGTAGGSRGLDEYVPG